MHAMLTALWLAMQDETPPDPQDDDDDEDDDGGGGLPVPSPTLPRRWPPRIRLYLPRLPESPTLPAFGAQRAPVPVPVRAS